MYKKLKPSTHLRQKIFRNIVVLLCAFLIGVEAKKGINLFAPIRRSKEFRCTVCFTPNECCLPLILEAMQKAKVSIHLQAYSFTSKPIADALIRSKERGVKVIVIVDKSQLKERHTQIKNLIAAGISVFIDYKPAIAHNKIIIFDEEKVLSGSYNFSAAAEHRNAENLLLIEDKECAQKYLKNFLSRLVVSKPYS